MSGASGAVHCAAARSAAAGVGTVALLTDMSVPLGLTVDHVIPRAKGGTDDITNLRPAHHRCNTSRQARPASDFQPPRSWSASPAPPPSPPRRRSRENRDRSHP